ncbi:MAG: TetR/AcrR family transcriptional regulator [Actinomycetia bacterium]|nr:TetR/AcrR family transcriptional regulator [Actinomycetes bacterium]
MARTDDSAPDGRVARRQRNIDAVLDVVLEMFTEEAMFPSIEQAATRSGLSLRSVYRYFSDPSELVGAAIERHRERTQQFAHIRSIGEGPLVKRVDVFVAMRLGLYEAVGAAYRATVHNAVSASRPAQELARNRDDFGRQFELQFAPELDGRAPGERQALLAAGDVLTQLDAIDLLRRHGGMSEEEAGEALRTGLFALLGGGTRG